MCVYQRYSTCIKYREGSALTLNELTGTRLQRTGGGTRRCFSRVRGGNLVKERGSCHLLSRRLGVRGGVARVNVSSMTRYRHVMSVDVGFLERGGVAPVRFWLRGRCAAVGGGFGRGYGCGIGGGRIFIDRVKGTSCNFEVRIQGNVRGLMRPSCFCLFCCSQDGGSRLVGACLRYGGGITPGRPFFSFPRRTSVTCCRPSALQSVKCNCYGYCSGGVEEYGGLVLGFRIGKVTCSRMFCLSRGLYGAPFTNIVSSSMFGRYSSSFCSMFRYRPWRRRFAMCLRRGARASVWGLRGLIKG